MSISQSCLAVCNPMNCSPPGSSVHGFLQARILEWDAIPFSRGSSWPRDFLHCRHTLYPLSHQGSQPNLEFRRMLLSSCVRNGLEGEGLVGRLAKAQESEGHAEGVWAWTGLFSQTREPAGGVEWEGPRGGNLSPGHLASEWTELSFHHIHLLVFVHVCSQADPHTSSPGLPSQNSRPIPLPNLTLPGLILPSRCLNPCLL